MKHILIYCQNFDNACAYWRTLGPFSRLHRQGRLHVTFSTTLSVELIANADVVLVQRPADVSIMQMIQSMNVPIIVDWDDPFWLVPHANPAYDEIQMRMQALTQCLEYADQIWVSTPNLADSISSFIGESTRTHTLPNKFVPRYMKYAVHTPVHNNVMVIRGSNTHMEDYDEHRNFLETISQARYRILWLGYRPYWAAKDLQVAFTNVRKYFTDILPHVTASYLFVPLKDNPFNRCKSDIAVIEAAMIGAIPIVPSWFEHSVPHAAKNVFEAANMAEKDFHSIIQANRDALVNPPHIDTINKLRLDLINAL